MRFDWAMQSVDGQHGHVSRRFSDFLMASSFFYSNNCSRSMLAKKMAALHVTVC